MWFIDYIIQRCNDASSFFYQIYLEVYDAIYPFYIIAPLFYYLSTAFSNLAWDFYSFGQWVDTTATKLLDILSWSTIQSYINNWLYWIGDLSTIFYYFWSNVTNIVMNWWFDESLVIISWIDSASSWLQSQLDSLTSWVSTLQLSWDAFKDKIPSLDTIIAWFSDWWGNVLAQVIAWGALTALEIDSLITSRLREWFPFYENIVEFFYDPLQWLESRFLAWFLGPE